MMRTTTSAALAILSITAVANAQGDPDVVQQIIEEGTTNSRVWEHLTYLSEQIGPRLTGSSRTMEANAWTRDQFAEFGLSNSHLFKWGEIPVRFDRGPSFARLVEPVARDLEFTTRAWGAGTDGVVRGHVLKAPKTQEDLDAIADHLEGAFILSPGQTRGRRRGVLPRGSVPAVPQELSDQLLDGNIAGVIVASRDELVHTSSLSGWRELDPNDLPTDLQIRVRRSDYDAMNSRIADGEEVIIEVEARNNFVEGPIPVFDTIAEIRGTEFPDEVVIISAHLDSWDGPGSMGTQDNGTGSSVTLETARILAEVGVQPRRTIRFILWTGEEQGLLGSRGYVESLTDEEKANISAVFVDDGGTNYQGGLQCIESMVDMLARATAPVNDAFPDMPVEIRSRERMPRGGGSDHAAFNRAGIPGFFWMEKGKGGLEGRNYRYVWHTQHDTPRYAVEEYLIQAATCSAVTAYNLAMADTLLPRQPPAEETPTETPQPTEDATPFEITTGPLSGAWEGVYTGENARSDSSFTFTFEMSTDGRARGTVKSRFIDGPFAGVTFDAETGKVNAHYNSDQIGRINYEGTLEGDTIKGRIWVPDMYNVDFEATRSTPESDVVAADDAAAVDETETDVDGDAATDAAADDAGTDADGAASNEEQEGGGGDGDGN